MRVTRAIQVGSLVLAVGIAGCGSSSSSSSIQPAPSASAPAATDSTAAAPTTTPTTAAPATAAPANPKLAHKPVVGKLSGPAPRTLVIKDLVKGTGPVAKSGQTANVQYVGVLFPSGKQFDASWDTGQPFQFQLGAGGVIRGWDQGVVGMRVGGRRELTIPAALAYGASGRPPTIPPNQPLVFVIDLLGVQ